MATRYQYRIVDGCAVFGRLYRSLPAARLWATELRQRRPELEMNGFEIERSLELPCGGRRYWRLNRGKWTLGQIHLDVPAAERGARVEFAEPRKERP